MVYQTKDKEPQGIVSLIIWLLLILENQTLLCETLTRPDMQTLYMPYNSTRNAFN